MSRRNKNRPRGAQTGQGVSNAVNVADAFSNPLFHLGFGSQSPLEATEYPLTRMTDNYALLNSLYRTNWVVQNVVGLAVDDMLREWYEITGSITPAATKALAKLERKTRLRARLNEGLRWGRLYGGAAGLILIKGQEDLSKPLDLGMIYPGSFQGLYILDRWQGITPNMGLVFDGGEEVPESYSITDGRGHTVATVHHSRVVRFTGRDLPRIERQTELYWGESEIEALYQEVVSHDNVSANMAALTFQANVNTMEVKGMEQLLSMSSPQVQRRFWQVMQAQATLRSNFGMQLVEQGNKLTNTQYSFAGLKDVYESMALNLCGASHYPMTKLFGRSPGGLNSTGESDLTNYYDYIDSQREAKLRPVLERLLPVLCMSALGGIPADIEVDFTPLKTPTPTERAEIGKTKAEAIAAAYTNGLLNVDTAQKELKKLEEETGLFGSISDEEIAANVGKSYQDATALRDPLAGLGFDGEATDSYPLYDYSPNQPRDRYGRWIPYGSAGASRGGAGNNAESRTRGSTPKSMRESAESSELNNARTVYGKADGQNYRVSANNSVELRQEGRERQPDGNYKTVRKSLGEVDIPENNNPDKLIVTGLPDKTSFMAFDDTPNYILSNGRIALNKNAKNNNTRDQVHGLVENEIDVLGGIRKDGHFYRVVGSEREIDYIKNGTIRKSVNHMTGEEEAGLSVWETPKYRTGTIIEVTGKPISIGSDGEPILDISSIKFVRKVDDLETMRANGRAAFKSLYSWTDAQVDQALRGGYELHR